MAGPRSAASGEAIASCLAASTNLRPPSLRGPDMSRGNSIGTVYGHPRPLKSHSPSATLDDRSTKRGLLITMSVVRVHVGELRKGLILDCLFGESRGGRVHAPTSSDPFPHT